MMLNYSLQENMNDSGTSVFFNSASSSEKTLSMNGKSTDIRIISEKISIPKSEDTFERQRLTELLAKQTQQFGNSLILGRAGTGKSTIAIEFAKDYECVAWFRVESADAEWETFSQYFLSSFKNSLPNLNFSADLSNQNIETKVLKFLEQLFNQIEKESHSSRILIVFDDLHSVFDAEWFEIFFQGLLSYQIPNVHILLLSRSKPAFPLWRLRSKQKLGVLEENLLLFTISELEKFLNKEKFSKDNIKRIYKSSYGRISKILELPNINFKNKNA